jgi:serine/threonine protein kinase
VLNPILSANAQIKERFRNEAKLMASLDDPNITKVIDFDEQPQQLSIVMEYLNGEDLNQKIQRNGPLSEKEITDVFSQTLSAFQYAHEKGIVHRDIKPSNIFILPNGHVKILDFGIAKLFGQGNEMTQTGTQMGTPIYMSPEQVKADKSIDHRSDIYSLGVTLFFTINGKPPYNSDTDSQFDIFNKIVYESLPELTGASYLSELIKKACNKDRDHRFQYCQEWIDTWKNKQDSSKITIDKKVIETQVSDNTIVEYPMSSSAYKHIKKINLDQSPASAYLLQFLFGLGFIRLKIDRKRSYFYIFFITYSWFSFINIFLVDFGRGPFGGIPFFFELANFHNRTSFGAISMLFGWFVGHIIGLFDLLITNRK